MLAVKQAEDIILVLLFNCLFFLLCIHNMSVHEQEDKTTERVEEKLELSKNWWRTSNQNDNGIRKGGRKNILMARKKISKIFFRPRRTVSSAELLLGLRFPLHLWAICAFCHWSQWEPLAAPRLVGGTSRTLGLVSNVLCVFYCATYSYFIEQLESYNLLICLI